MGEGEAALTAVLSDLSLFTALGAAVTRGGGGDRGVWEPGAEAKRASRLTCWPPAAAAGAGADAALAAAAANANRDLGISAAGAG